MFEIAKKLGGAEAKAEVEKQRLKTDLKDFGAANRWTIPTKQQVEGRS